jgi:hypothetical protein
MVLGGALLVQVERFVMLVTVVVNFGGGVVVD